MTAEHVFCQRCGDPVPKGVEPVDFTITKITNPAHPNVVEAARINLWVKCPSCRHKIIIAVNYFNSVEDAQAVIDKAYEKIEEEKKNGVKVLPTTAGDNGGVEAEHLQPSTLELHTDSDPVDTDAGQETHSADNTA